MPLLPRPRIPASVTRRGPVTVRPSLPERLATLTPTTTPYRGVRKPHHGYAGTIPYLPEWRGTSWHTSGHYPFINGATAPREGAPVGFHATTGQPVHFDPLGWWDAQYITNPTAFVLGGMGVGKSTLIRKMIAGVIGRGELAMVLGDRKNEYSKLIGGMEDAGQVIPIGIGVGAINVLDPGGVLEAVDRIRAHIDPAIAAPKIDALLGAMHHRRTQTVTALIEIIRGERVPLHEVAMLDTALRHLHDTHTGVPILADLRAVVEDGPPALRAHTTNPKDIRTYRTETKALRRDLTALCAPGSFGALFNGHTTAPIRLDTSVCFEVSSIHDGDHDLLGAAYLAVWAAGFSTLEVMHALADLGLTRRRRYQVVLDEFWQPMAAGPGMVDRTRSVTKLTREDGISLVYATHVISDLKAIRNPEDVVKAMSIIGTVAVVVIGGMRRNELAQVAEIVAMTDREQSTILAWGAPGARGATHPGKGKFLIKTAERPGLPVATRLTALERTLGIHDTDETMRRQDTHHDEEPTDVR